MGTASVFRHGGLTVVSPFAGDWREGSAPPNNVYLRRHLERRGLLSAWLEPPAVPTFPWGSRWLFLHWYAFRFTHPPLDVVADRTVLCLSPALYPVLSLARRVVLKTFGFDMFLHGWSYRLRMPDLRYALAHPPDAWILTDDGSHPPDVLKRLIRYPPERTLVVRNARPGRDLFMPLPPPPLRVLFAGRLDRLKGVDLLLRIVPSLMERKDLELWIAGRGPFAPAVEALTRRFPRVRFLGFLPWDELLATYGRVHLVLHLARHANAPLPVVEALAAGRGVVGIPAFPGWVNLGEGEGVRWFQDLPGLVRGLREITFREVEELSRRAYHQGRHRFPTWEEETAREVDWLEQMMEVLA